jgi:hypothetical protein
MRVRACYMKQNTAQRWSGHNERLEGGSSALITSGNVKKGHFLTRTIWALLYEEPVTVSLWPSEARCKSHFLIVNGDLCPTLPVVHPHWTADRPPAFRLNVCFSRTGVKLLATTDKPPSPQWTFRQIKTFRSNSVLCAYEIWHTPSWQLSLHLYFHTDLILYYFFSGGNIFTYWKENTKLQCGCTYARRAFLKISHDSRQIFS